MDRRLIHYLTTLGVGQDALDGWVAQTAQRNGEDVGFVLTCGTEIHILPIAERRSMSRRNISAFLKPILDEFGFVTTRVPITESDHKLREVLGFERTWSDEHFSYWALTTLPFQRTVK